MNTEHQVLVKIADNTGDTELLLGIKAAALEIMNQLKTKTKWAYARATGTDGFDLLQLSGDLTAADQAGLEATLEGTDQVLVTQALVGGLEDYDSAVVGEVVDDTVVATVLLSLVDDDGEGSTVDLKVEDIGGFPQLVVSIVPSSVDGEADIVNVVVRNTEKSKQRLASAVPQIITALLKVRDDVAQAGV